MSRPEAQRLSALGNKAASTMFMIMRNLRMYDPGNEVFREPLALLAATINEVVATDGKLTCRP